MRPAAPRCVKNGKAKIIIKKATVNDTQGSIHKCFVPKIYNQDSHIFLTDPVVF